MIYQCRECELKFYAKDLKTILRLDKMCVPCKQFFTRTKNAKIKLPKLVYSKVPNKKTCKRCGVHVDTSVGSCTVCDCTEFVS